MKKVELHVHLDGSLNVERISKLLNKDIKDNMQITGKINNLDDYLTKFDIPISVLQTKEDLENGAKDLLNSLKKDKVIYAEVRFCPLFHLKYLTINEVIETLIESFKDCDIKVNLLLCMMRGINLEDNKKIIDSAYKYLNKGVCGIDLAGSEAKYDVMIYKELFNYASSLNIPFTIHAGEADGYESVDNSIKLGAKRIGHGIRSIENINTINLLKKNNILLEVCVTCNLQTCNIDLENHPIKKLYEAGVLISINTDNRTVSNTDLNHEYNILSNYFTKEDFIKFNINAINSAFISNKEKEEIKNKLLN